MSARLNFKTNKEAPTEQKIRGGYYTPSVWPITFVVGQFAPRLTKCLNLVAAMEASSFLRLPSWMEQAR